MYHLRLVELHLTSETGGKRKETTHGKGRASTHIDQTISENYREGIQLPSPGCRFRKFQERKFKVSNQGYQRCPGGILGPPGINNAIYDFGQEWFDLCL
jgi:hypothetical protein